MSRVESGWLRVPGSENPAAAVEIRVNGGDWEPAFSENGEALVRYGGDLPVAWEVRVDGQVTGSGTIGRPAR